MAEFFAGIGLVRRGVECCGSLRVVWANDIDAKKQAMYAANFDDSHFLLADVRTVDGASIPDVDLATASFPCTDLSLAGNRAGLAGHQSGMLWEFLRIVESMNERRPPAILLENVPSFATSHGGQDLVAAVTRLNDLGYSCDLLVVDARHFVAQSRPRLFIVGLEEADGFASDWSPSLVRPPWIGRFVERHTDLRLHAYPLRLPLLPAPSLADFVEQLPEEHRAWWPEQRCQAFVSSLSELQAERLERLRTSPVRLWATAYRRTRSGKAVWEIRNDGISGCLRTARGGSSKQAVVEAGCDEMRMRWMTAREYANLQGAPDFAFDGVSVNQALFGFGDAVCVPVVDWLARSYLRIVLAGRTAAVESVG